MRVSTCKVHTMYTRTRCVPVVHPRVHGVIIRFVCITMFPKLQASMYDILPTTAAITGYDILPTSAITGYDNLPTTAMTGYATVSGTSQLTSSTVFRFCSNGSKFVTAQTIRSISGRVSLITVNWRLKCSSQHE